MCAVQSFPRHVIRTQDFTPEMLEQMFDRAQTMHGCGSDLLHGSILCSLFYQPSTRTRHSFEAGMLRLGGRVIGTENAREFSSAAKGESLEDSIRVEGYYCDIIVLRHTEADAAERAARVSSKPIINAGCGTGQHPTQAFLDLFTIKRLLGGIDGISIGFMGDVCNSRVVRSNGYLLGKYPGVKQHYISAPGLGPDDDMKAHFADHSIPYTVHDKIDDMIGTLDVLYVTRLQREYLPLEQRMQYDNGSGYGLSRKLAERMKKGSIILHPLPRNDELSPDVDSLLGAAYMTTQVESGLWLRMALLAMLLGK